MKVIQTKTWRLSLVNNLQKINFTKLEALVYLTHSVFGINIR